MGVDLTLCIDGSEIFRRQPGLDNLCVFRIKCYILAPLRGVDLTLCIDVSEVFRRQPGLDNLYVFFLEYCHLAPHGGRPYALY